MCIGEILNATFLSGIMKKSNTYAWVGFVVLALTVFGMRDIRSGLVPFFLATGAVILFWYFQGLEIAFTSLRNILLISACFGLAILIFRNSVRGPGQRAETGAWQGFDLDPASISSLKTSHELAVSISLDRRPTESERYFKLGTLKNTKDGLRYTRERVTLDRRLLPKTKVWVEQNLTDQNLVSQNPGSVGLNEKISRIRNWWTDHFVYSSSPGALETLHPLDKFLFESKKGFCEHYATALATLLNLSGAQARVAVGFAGGSWNPIFRTLSYEMADAHAWVEVLDPSPSTGGQWRRVDPTLWVTSTEVQSRTDFTLLLIVCLCPIVILALLVWARGKRSRKGDPLQRFLTQLRALEKRSALDQAENQTIAERVRVLTTLRPDLESKLARSLDLYLALYYREDRNPRLKRKMHESLRVWQSVV